MRLLRCAYQAFTLNDSPRQLAMGLAMGISVGLLPTDNLIFVSLALIAVLSPINLGTAFVSAVLVWRVGGVLDPLSHSIGHAVLTFEPFQPTLTLMYKTVWVPWTGLDNTVVVGSAVIVVTQFYFTYCLSKPVFAWFRGALYKLFGVQASYRPEAAAS